MTATMALVSSTRSPKSIVATLAAVALLSPALALAAEGREQTSSPSRAPAAPSAATSSSSRPAPHRAASITQKAKDYYRSAWGVDGLQVSRVASGSLIRFTYRVTNPMQAAPLTDRNVNPVLYAPRTRAMLSVPAMEKVGPLRQTGALKAGQEYWMAFSNKGNLVKPGDRVNVIVGRFHADGLVVE
jgi:hypothetical protein